MVRVLPLVENFSARSDNHSYLPTIPKRGNTMIRAGDMFKNIESGKVFAVKSVDLSIIILGTKDGSHSMFVNPNSMESVFLPFVEDEVKTKPK
ncbi:MAG: hypothetical protein MUO29_05825 [Desulfobacterales bacterium]|nr:hypothetical protein [Desulfobacterales bacterium]